MTPWERPVPHHKWADELEAESRVKDALRKAKKAAKDEDHSKKCPYCEYEPVKKLKHPGLAPDDPDQYQDTYLCEGCKRMYRVKCPGTILLGGNPIVAEGSEQDDGWETVDKEFVKK